MDGARYNLCTSYGSKAPSNISKKKPLKKELRKDNCLKVSFFLAAVQMQDVKEKTSTGVDSGQGSNSPSQERELRWRLQSQTS